MTPSDGLNIEAVISQFRASEQTLEEVRERLKNILLAGKTVKEKYIIFPEAAASVCQRMNGSCTEI